KKFWRNLVYYLANQEDQANPLWVELDKRRLNANASDILRFRFGLRGKSGDLANATYTAKIISPGKQEIPVTFVRDDQNANHQRGTFQSAKEAGEFQLVITGASKKDEVFGSATARFLVAFD